MPVSVCLAFAHLLHSVPAFEWLFSVTQLLSVPVFLFQISETLKYCVPDLKESAFLNQ